MGPLGKPGRPACCQPAPRIAGLAVTAAGRVGDRPAASGGRRACAPGLLQRFLVSLKTKEVQKAMDEKRFDEAIQLRGR